MLNKKEIRQIEDRIVLLEDANRLFKQSKADRIQNEGFIQALEWVLEYYSPKDDTPHAKAWGI